MLVRDISADIIYRYNVKKIFNIKQLKRGDFIFFDQDDDNIMWQCLLKVTYKDYL